MAGEINFKMADVYGFGFSTTEETIPEAADQNALVDDQKAAAAVSESGQKKTPIYMAVACIAVVAFIVGVLR